MPLLSTGEKNGLETRNESQDSPLSTECALEQCRCRPCGTQQEQGPL